MRCRSTTHTKQRSSCQRTSHSTFSPSVQREKSWKNFLSGVVSAATNGPIVVLEGTPGGGSTPIWSQGSTPCANATPTTHPRSNSQKPHLVRHDQVGPWTYRREPDVQQHCDRS